MCRYNLMTLLKTFATQIYFCFGVHQRRILISFYLQWQNSLSSDWRILFKAFIDKTRAIERTLFRILAPMTDLIWTQMTNEETVMTSRAPMSMLAGSELLVIRSQRQKQDLHHTGSRDYKGISELTEIQLIFYKVKSAALEVVQTSQYNPWQDPSLALGLSLSTSISIFILRSLRH